MHGARFRQRSKHQTCENRTWKKGGGTTAPEQEGAVIGKSCRVLSVAHFKAYQHKAQVRFRPTGFATQPMRAPHSCLPVLWAKPRSGTRTISQRALVCLKVCHRLLMNCASYIARNDRGWLRYAERSKHPVGSGRRGSGYRILRTVHDTPRGDENNQPQFLETIMLQTDTESCVVGKFLSIFIHERALVVVQIPQENRG